MASYVTPKKNTQYIFYVGLVDQSNTKLLKANPTIAAGDFQVSTDGGALGNLGTLPTVTPAAGRMVKITLSAAEMNGDNVTVVCVDAAGAEWCDQLINLQTSARQIDDLAYPATSGRSMVVDASGLVDATAVKVGPTGAGTAQTARDIGLSVLLSSGTGTGQVTLTGGAVTNVINLVNSPGDSSGVTTLLSRIASAITISGGGVNISGDLSATMKTSVEAAAWDATAASHNTAGTTGAKLNSAASAGDPWSTALPGAYAAGTAGAIVGALNGIVAAIWAYGTRTLSAFGFTVATASDTNVTAIKAKTDQLAFTVANRVDASLASNPNTYTQQGTGDSPYLGR